MVAPTPGNRRDRRNEAAVLAKYIMHSSQHGRGPDYPWVLALLGLAVSAILFVLVHSKGAIIFSLVVALVSLVYVGIHLLPRWAQKSLTTIKGWMALWTVVSLALLLLVGAAGWPRPTDRYLSDGQKDSLASYVGHDPFTGTRIQVCYVATDVEAYHYAVDFITALEQGRWKVEPPRATAVILDRPFAGIEIWYSDKDLQVANALADAMKNINVESVDLRRMPGIGLQIVVGPKP